MGQRNRNTHPVPGILLIIRGLIPIRHEEQSLNKDESVEFIVKVVEKLRVTCVNI